ncbi:daptide-type RiPP [Streptomyces tubercidicus]
MIENLNQEFGAQGIELEMQELEAMEAPGWGTFSAGVSVGISVSVAATLT